MRTFNKLGLYAGVSALALGLGLSQASAFDQVDWDWDLEIDQRIDIDLSYVGEFDPTGIVQVEKLQISLGNKTAVSTLYAFINDPHTSYEEGLTQTTVTQTDGWFGGGFNFSGVIKDEEIAYLNNYNSYYGSYSVPVYAPDYDFFYGGGHFGGAYSETVEVTVDIADPIDALLHLPQVEVSALAIGNSESITSTVGVLIHEGQFTVGEPTGEGGGINGYVEVPVELAVAGTAEGYIDIDASGNNPNQRVYLVGIAGQPDGVSNTEGGVAGINGGEDPLAVTGTATGTVLVPVLGTSDWLNADNEHTALADTMLSLALQGLITPAQLSATSSAGLVVNAAADISAISIANNHAIDLDAATADDATVVADLVQFAYADNVATASLGFHKVSNYTNLGELENALSRVSSVAAGNISNITVNSCGLCAVDVPDVPGGGGDDLNP